jgi:outer membrane protein OmpA-like peptidoglycan-associated protein
MKARGIFLLFILFSIAIIALYLYIFSKPLHLERLEKERIANIQKVCMKKSPRNRDRAILQRTVLEADKEIQTLLLKKAIYFEPSSVDVANENRVVLKKIIDVLNNINEDVILSISAHTDKDGSSIKNLKLSQQRADVLKEYIRERTDIVLITSIGYGEELPLAKRTKEISNRRIEINLKRIKR